MTQETNVVNLDRKETNPEAEKEKFTGLYKEYQWSRRVICTNIRSGKLTPIFKGLPEAKGDYRAFCPICYLFYPEINVTTCCDHCFCTECFAGCVNHPPSKIICPGCRKENFSFKSKVNYKDAPKAGPGSDDIYGPCPDINDANGILSDTAMALCLQYPTINNLIIRLSKEGKSDEDLLKIVEKIENRELDLFVLSEMDDSGMDISQIWEIIMS